MTVNPSYNEKDLLLQVSAGNELLFTELFNRYKGKVYSFAMFLTRSEVMAEDITQEIFTKVWMNRSQLSEIDHFTSWLKTIIRNHTYTYLRRIGIERLILEDVHYLADKSSDTTRDTILFREYGRLLQQAIDRLSPQQKKAYLLSRKSGFSHEAIAREMDISVNTVKNHISLALQSIRLFLDARTDIMVVIAMALFFAE